MKLAGPVGRSLISVFDNAAGGWGASEASGLTGCSSAARTAGTGSPAGGGRGAEDSASLEGSDLRDELVE